MRSRDAAMVDALLRYFRVMDLDHQHLLINLARRLATGEHHAPRDHVSRQSALTNH